VGANRDEVATERPKLPRRRRKPLKDYSRRFTTADLTCDFVFSMAQRGMTQNEIGCICGVTQGRISQVFKENEDLGMAWVQGRAELQLSLRGYQTAAAEAGDRTMLVWLGKNELGQRDSIKEIEAHVDTQITYVAIWGGEHGGELPARFEKALEAGIPEDTIEGEIVADDIIDLTCEEEEEGNG